MGSVHLTFGFKPHGRGPRAEADAARRLPPLRLMSCGRRAAVTLGGFRRRLGRRAEAGPCRLLTRVRLCRTAACADRFSQGVIRARPVGSADCDPLPVQQAENRCRHVATTLNSLRVPLRSAAHVDDRPADRSHGPSQRKLAALPLYVPKPRLATLGGVRRGRFGSDRKSER